MIEVPKGPKKVPSIVTPEKSKKSEQRPQQSPKKSEQSPQQSPLRSQKIT